VGGLGDVVTSLARAVEEAGHCVEVILPKYNNLDYSQVRPTRCPITHDRLSIMHAQILHQSMVAASFAI
jgi:glycogen synthase